MKNVFKIFMLIGLFCFLVTKANCQILETEKTYEISKKAKKGFLGDAKYDADKGYTLSYVTKANKTMARFEVYSFDKDFNFIKMDQDEIEFAKAKEKHPWWSYRGDEYDVVGITADPNLSGTLVLRKRRYINSFNWWLGAYQLTFKTLDKVKLKSDEGNKYSYLTDLTDEKTGEIFVLCGEMSKTDENAFAQNLHLLKIDNNLNVIKDVPIKVDYPQTCAFSAKIIAENKDYEVDNLIIIIAPTDEAKKKDPDKTNYTYLRFNNKLEIVDRIAFKSPSSYWKIDVIATTGEGSNDEIYLFGPAAAGKDKYFNRLVGMEKFKAVQLMKVKNKKIEYLTETDLKEFETKLKLPPSQKKAPAYRGAKFKLNDKMVTSKGEFFIIGQNWSTKYNVIKDEIRDVYGDILAFQFDKNGVLKAQYGLDTEENNEYTKLNGTPQDIIEGKENVFWMVKEPKSNGLKYPRIGKINVDKGTINDFIIYGKRKFFLEPNYPYFMLDNNTKVVLFGSDKSGRIIWFTRLKLD